MSIRTLIFALGLPAVLGVALPPSSAWAQFGMPGGYAPFAVEAPVAAAAASRANEASQEQQGANCTLQSHGRDGDRYQCDPGPHAAPQR